MWVGTAAGPPFKMKESFMSSTILAVSTAMSYVILMVGLLGVIIFYSIYKRSL